MNIDDINLSDKDSGAINYVKARIAIEELGRNRAEKRDAKLVVINYLGGKIGTTDPDKVGKHRLVIFPDKTKARF